MESFITVGFSVSEGEEIPFFDLQPSNKNRQKRKTIFFMN